MRLLFNHPIFLTAAILAAVCFWSCNNSHSKPAISEAERWQQHRLQLYNDSLYPAMFQQVKDADLITRLGSDMTSELISKLNLQDQSFSHCGIASIENDTVFVYHAIGGEFNPDQVLKREPLYSFAHPADNKALGIFRPQLNKSQKAKLLQLAKQAYRQKLMFDMKFDYQSEERQYCAEFVAKSYARAKQDSSWLHFSKTGDLEYVAVDNLFKSKLVWEVSRYSY